MKKAAYIELLYGASGDMLLAAFIDAGLPVEHLKKELTFFCPVSFDIEVRSKVEKGITGKAVRFVFEESNKEIRTLKTIKKLLKDSAIGRDISGKSLKVFELIAETEAKIHNTTPDKVHFHEIGAIDSLLDVAGFFVAAEYFSLDRFVVGKIPVGRGSFEGSHGILPVPAFATLDLLRGLNVYGIEVEKENITPTAAGILKSCAISGIFPDMVVEKTGYGCGNYDFGKYRNMLRITMGEVKEEAYNDEVMVMEFVVDDINPEILGNFMDRSFEKGIFDCFFTPVYMKKNRPGIHVTLLCPVWLTEDIYDMVFRETTTLGIRCRRERRIALKREEKKIKTSMGTVRVKVGSYRENIVCKPEFDDLKKIAADTKLPLKEVYSIILKELNVKK